MDNFNPERRFALLIDADNVSAKYLKPILDELSKYGTVTYKRIYGDWTLNLHAKWKEELLKNSITPIQQFGYTQGKNATDSAMIIDAMDILYANSVEGFCIVSSDSDFTRLAVRLRESGRMVIGMGEKKTPTPFRTACDVFTTLELLVPERTSRSRRNRRNKNEELETIQEATATRAQIEQAVIDIISDNINNGKATGLGEVGSRLLKIYPDFDVRSYGTSQISKLLDSFASVEVKKNGYNVAVELADGIEPGTILEELESIEETNEAEAAEAPVEALETEETTEEAVSEESNTSRRRRRRGGRSRRKLDTSKEATESEPLPAEEKTEEIAAEPPAAIEAPSEEKPKRSRRRKKTVKEEPAEEVAAQEQKPEKSKNAEAPTSPNTEESVTAKVSDYIAAKLKAAGDEGIAVGKLGRSVRGKFRTFKLRELGFQNLRAYLATIQGVQVEKNDEDFFAYMR